LGLWKAAALFDDGFGKELRHSLGLRLWKTKGNWKYDFETVYQNGKFVEKKISAWTASLNTSYVFAGTKLKPELGVRTELISGDRFYNDQNLGTFNPLFPKGAYFGLAALIGPANLMDFHPLLSLSLSSKVLLGLDCDCFWRYSRNDGLYAVSGALIYSGKNTYSKYIGCQPAMNITYAVSELMNIRTEFTWFNAGSYLQESGSGKDIYFAAFTAGIRVGH
jgi:Alginate export